MIADCWKMSSRQRCNISIFFDMFSVFGVFQFVFTVLVPKVSMCKIIWLILEKIMPVVAIVIYCN